MGQYYKVANLERKEYLDPGDCGDGRKLMEFGASGGGTMNCLAILLAEGNGRGGGDCHSTSKIVGSWAGDRIVIIGDYADEGSFSEDPTKALYEEISGWRNISSMAMAALREDQER